MPKVSKTKPIMAYPPKELAAKVEKIAAEQRRSVSNLIITWIEERPEIRGGSDG
jgi:hypothetical protein